MKISKILTVGIVATSFMTFYSYVLAQIKDEHFTEPLILSELLHRLLPTIEKRYSLIVGWHMHYFVGLLFAAIYIYLWYNRGIRPSYKNGLILGGVSGAIAIAVWRAVLRMHPNPPNIKLHRYFGQLFIAHLVFGVAATLGYNDNQA